MNRKVIILAFVSLLFCLNHSFSQNNNTLQYISLEFSQPYYLYYDIDNYCSVKIDGQIDSTFNIVSNYSKINHKSLLYLKSNTYLSQRDTITVINKVGQKIISSPVVWINYPWPRVKLSNNNTISKKEILGHKKLELENYVIGGHSHISLSFQVSGFSICIVSKGQAIEVSSLNQYFTDEMIKLFEGLSSGDKLYIENIKVTSAVGNSTYISPLMLKIR